MHLNGEDLREHTSDAAGSAVKEKCAMRELCILSHSTKRFRWPLYGEASLNSNWRFRPRPVFRSIDTSVGFVLDKGRSSLSMRLL